MPNAKVLESKKAVVEALTGKIKEATSVVFVDYKGINVAQDTALRQQFREAGVEYTVVKNTLTSKACDIIGFEGLKDQLTGMTALATCADDPVAPAKILNDYAKDHENFVLKAGFVDGELLDANGVKELADTPSKEVLIAKMLGCFQSSLSKFVGVLDQIAKAKESN